MATDLPAQVQAVLRQWEGSDERLRPRLGQGAMADAVAKAITDDAVLVVEAGTGVGKTFAYLLPALLSGRKLVVSTATKALQDQLYHRDAPRLLAHLALPLRLALLKGRSSYLCLHRLQRAQQAGQQHDAALWRALAQVQQWSSSTTSGDLAELPTWDEYAPVAPLVSSTRSNCLGSDCAFWQACYVNQARAKALEAEVCIVNHHVLFADQELQEEGARPLLPQVGVVVVDEAHQLNDVGVQFAGISLSTRQLLNWVRAALRQTTSQALGLQAWVDDLARLEQAVLQWRALLADVPAGQRLAWQGLAPEGISAEQWQRQVQQVGRSLRRLWLALGQALEAAPALQNLYRRAGHWLQYLAWCLQPSPLGSVRWIERRAQHWTLVQAPLNAAPMLQAMMQRPDQEAGAGQAWVFTSATLGDTPGLDWFVRSCDLKQARVLRVPSPFDYPRQAALYVPPDLPDPAQTAAHSAAVAALALEGAWQLGGRTLVLTTTLRALHNIAAHLQQGLQGPRPAGARPVQLLVQGQASKAALITRLSADQQNGQGCILVASAALWEGVDIPGDALQLLVMDKLPFAPPDDPIVQARIQELEAVGLHPFHDYSLPEAAMALKQGAGRLIRSETDRGIVVIGDTRLLHKPYGARLLNALPPMRRLEGKGDWLQALQWLAQQ